MKWQCRSSSKMAISKALLIYIVVLCIITSSCVIEKNEVKTTKANHTKVYMLLLDSADPVIVDFLIKNNRLPNFKFLKEKGASGNVTSIKTLRNNRTTIISLPVIATIFTGKTPQEHGMTSHIFVSDGPDYYYPFTEMPIPAIWNIANFYNLSVGIVGTQGNIPIDKVKGFIVSGEYTIKRQAMQNLGLAERLFVMIKYPDWSIVFPSSMAEEAGRHIGNGREISEEYIKYGFPYDFPAAIEENYAWSYRFQIMNSPSKAQLKTALRVLNSNKTAYYVFADDYNRMKLSNYFYNAYRPDLFIEYLEGIDFFGNLFSTYEYTNFSNLDSIPFRYYEFFDKHIGEILRNIDNNTVLIVVSDHGMRQQASLINFSRSLPKREQGILFVYGPNIKQAANITKASVYDITPMTLYIMGLAVGDDMKGRARREIYERVVPKKHVKSYRKNQSKTGVTVESY